MVKVVAPLAGSLDHQHQSFLDFLLAAEFAECRGAQGQIETGGRRFGRACVKGFSHKVRLLANIN